MKANLNFIEAKKLESKQIRTHIRNNTYVNHTAGLAKNKLQTNIVILHKEFSDDFYQFCKRNSKACPLVGMTKIGSYTFNNLGENIDVRHDVPSYNIYKNGKHIKSLNNIESFWNKNLVAFAIGCSFTFEHDLLKNNFQIDHILHNKIVPMYKTNLKNIKSGVFSGEMVTSMRIFKKTDKEKIINISKKFSYAHGEPIHIGEPNEIGITDIMKPNWGDSPRTKSSDEDYYFWACGVTPQNAVMEAKLPFCITHTPGHMLITDVNEKDLISLYN